MSMTFLQLVNEVLLGEGDPVVPGLTSPSSNTQRAMNAVNAAVDILARLRDWNFLYLSSTFTTTAASRNLDLDTNVDWPPRFKRIYRTATSYFELVELPAEIWNIRTQTVVTGLPTGFRFGGLTTDGSGNRIIRLELDPRPTSAISIFVENYRIPARMTVDADRVMFPDQAIIWEALAIRLDMIGDARTKAEEMRDRALLPLIQWDMRMPHLRQGQLSGRTNGPVWPSGNNATTGGEWWNVIG